MAIGRLKKRTWFLDRFEVLVNGSGSFTGHFLCVVRPADAPDAYLQLYLTEKNWLVGLAGKNRMHLAYDLNLGKRYAWGEVLSLSPFILIGDGTPLKQTDCNHLLGLGMNTGPSAPSSALKLGQPRESVIKEALNSRNPEVRALAQKLVSARKAE